jgi:hypothetical protein
VSDAPTDPGPEQASDADGSSAPRPPASHADPVPEPAAPSPGGSAEPSDPPSGARPPLRPVDWDGSFSRTWQSRDRNEVMNRLFDEYEFQAERQELDQTMRELLDKLKADTDARAREEREGEHAAAERHAGDDSRSRLFDKLGRLGGSSDAAEASPDGDGDGSPGTR